MSNSITITGAEGAPTNSHGNVDTSQVNGTGWNSSRPDNNSNSVQAGVNETQEAHGLQVVGNYMSAVPGQGRIYELSNGFTVTEDELVKYGLVNQPEAVTPEEAAQNAQDNADHANLNNWTTAEDMPDLNGYGDTVDQLGGVMNELGFSDDQTMDALVSAVTTDGDIEGNAAIDAFVADVGEEHASEVLHYIQAYGMAQFSRTASDIGLTQEQAEAALANGMKNGKLVSSVLQGRTDGLRTFLSSYRG